MNGHELFIIDIFIYRPVHNHIKVKKTGRITKVQCGKWIS